jgi:hypothetical protein
MYSYLSAKTGSAFGHKGRILSISLVRRALIQSVMHLISELAVSVVNPDPHLFYCFWIRLRIRIGNADPDPGAGKLTKIYNKPGFLPVKRLLYLLKYVRYVFDIIRTLL